MIINNTYKKPTFGIPQAQGKNLPNFAIGNTANTTAQTRNITAPKTINTRSQYVKPSFDLPGQTTPAPASKPSGGLVNTNLKNNSVTTPNPEASVQTFTSEKTKNSRGGMDKGSNREKRGLVKPDQTQFGSILNRLQKASAPTNDQRRLTAQMEEEAMRNREIADQAKAYSEQYANEIARVGQLGAGAVAGNLSTGSNVVGSGNANLASQAASSRISALSQAQQAALQGTSQQLAGQGQLQSALNQTSGNLNTQQAQQLSGLGTAGSLAAPNPAQYGQTVFDPATGQFTGGNLDPQTQAANLAQQVMSGAMTYEQALASLGYAGSAGTNFLNNAITSSGGNPLQLQAQGGVQQANIATTGTLGTNIAAAGLSNVTPQYVQTEANVTAAKQQAGRALEILQKTGLNNVSSTDFNKAANELKSRFGDEGFAAFNTAINEAKNFYTSVLASGGGTPSGNEEIASNIAALNINSPIKAIVASLKELEFASATRLQSLSSQQGQYNQNIGGGGFSGGGGTIGGWDDPNFF